MMSLTEGFEDSDNELRALTDAFADDDDFEQGFWGREDVNGDDELIVARVGWIDGDDNDFRLEAAEGFGRWWWANWAIAAGVGMENLTPICLGGCWELLPLIGNLEVGEVE